MNNINSIETLKAHILLLEQKKAEEIQLLKTEIVQSMSLFDSKSLIGNSLKEFFKTPSMNSEFIDSTISYTAGFLTKKMAFGNSNNPIKNLLGTILQIGVSSFANKNSMLIRKGIEIMVEKIRDKK